MKTDDPKKLMDKIKKDFDKFVNNGDMWDEVGRELIESIRGLTKGGKGATKNFAAPVKFDELAASTKKSRGAVGAADKKAKAAAKKAKTVFKPKLDIATSPNKSNLRFSGQMFRDLTHFVKKGRVIIDFKTERSKEIAGYHHENTRIPTRPFMFVSKAQFRNLQAILQKYIDKFIKEI